MTMYRGEKHKKSGKHDGIRPVDRVEKRDKKSPPQFENHNGEKID
ncbi:hypothetical protein [Clostridium sp. 19966]|nr:hypothetical protein [Clostridium sp. 19966]